MARKRSAREEADSSKPRQLRKRLRKAEDQLADAVQKRDRAQARVEALNIIADEIRAQLADLEKSEKAEAAEQDASAPASQSARAPRRGGKARGRPDRPEDGQASALVEPAGEVVADPPRARSAPRKKSAAQRTSAAAEPHGVAD